MLLRQHLLRATTEALISHMSLFRFITFHVQIPLLKLDTLMLHWLFLLMNIYEILY